MDNIIINYIKNIFCLHFIIKLECNVYIFIMKIDN